MRWFMVCIVTMPLLLIAALSFAGLSGSLDEQKIIERIKPFGEVKIEGATAEKTVKTLSPAELAKSHYDQYCKLCHEAGLAGAPKFGSKEEWAPRISQGLETLVKHAIIGLKAMPPRGTCATCTDEEIKKTVEYMVDHAK